jgi:hypothetical protein
VTAQKWIDMGITSIKQLRAAEKRQEYNLLTRNQSTGQLSGNILTHTTKLALKYRESGCRRDAILKESAAA